MNLEITVGPQQLAIHQGVSVLITDPDGQVPWPTDKGLYFSDTRMISAWLLFANGVSWDLLNSASIAHYAARMFLTNREIVTEDGVIAPRDLSLSLSRTVGGGIHEDIDLTNHSMKRVRFNLEIIVRSDFADIFEVKSGKIVRRGRIVTNWDRRAGRLTATYRNKDFRRDVTITARKADSKPVFANGRISFEVDLEPGQSWHACLLYDLGDGKARIDAPSHCIGDAPDSVAGQWLDNWQGQVLKIRTSNEEVYRIFNQAVQDTVSLRLPAQIGSDHEFVPAAGVPWFVALFGRDSLIASMQSAMVYPDLARGTLDVLAAHQARERDDYRDAEPGKMMHELRSGELAHFKLIPHTPYYGAADATPLYLILLHNAWRCTGDKGLLERHLETAERCLSWIDDYGDRDGDGFQEYQTRSSAGYENQGWKDSGEALVYEDGTLVKGPKALCELQGYVYDAWQRMAEVFDALDKPDRAAALRVKAHDLFIRFNEAFWDEEAGYYAFCLDGEKKKVMSVASNPGHCLWSGIVPQDRAERVVRRLMAPDMWSGWGIRTLSSLHPAFNPYSYQNGSVWPHDNGIIALGFRRYGFAAEAAAIARDISGAAGYFMLHQAPELYAGVQRDSTSFPVQYVGANVPQAWAAGSCFHMLEAVVGFQPDAPAGMLFIDPALPPWITDLTAIDLRLGEQSFDVHFWRDGEETRWEVIKGDPTRVVQRSCATGPLRPDSPQREPAPKAVAKA
jgi:glycogen debranching enzyme